MLVPAILYKEEIQKEFKKCYYTDDMMFESGSLRNWSPDIAENPDESTFQYAIINNDNKLIGYLSYYVDWYSSNAFNFGLLSFDRGNPIVGADLFAEMNKLLNEYHLHRIEWRMVGGNPVEKSYDRFCKTYGGRKLEFRDTFKDRNGNYRNSYIYEIIQRDSL